MEDDKIKDLFAEYRPEGGMSDFEFMQRLRRGMEAVELVREHQRERIRRGRRALVLAALVGVVTGVSMTLLLMGAGRWISAVDFPLFGMPEAVVDYRTLVWLVVGATSVLLSLNTYELALGSRYAGQRGNGRK